jgi:selenocysteine lyase/cysteine desulfurase
VLLGFPSEIKDIDCAFKLIRREVLREIEPLFSNGAMISTELLLKLHYGQFRTSQVGVTHYPRKYGHPTGSNLRVIFKAVQDTFLLQRKLISKRLNNRQRRLSMRWEAISGILAVGIKSVTNRAT